MILCNIKMKLTKKMFDTKVVDINTYSILWTFYFKSLKPVNKLKKFHLWHPIIIKKGYAQLVVVRGLHVKFNIFRTFGFLITICTYIQNVSQNYRTHEFISELGALLYKTSKYALEITCVNKN